MQNDLISRSALLEELNIWLCSLDPVGDSGLRTALESVSEAVSDAPSVDAEPVRHGRWEVGNSDFGWAEDINCSECGSMYTFFKKPNYRPNCGSKMDAELEYDE